MEKSKVEKKEKSSSKKMLSSNPILGSNPIAEKRNPFIEKTDSIVAKINNFNTYRTNNRLYATKTVEESRIVDYAELLGDMYNNFKKATGLHELFNRINNTFNEKIRVEC